MEEAPHLQDAAAAHGAGGADHMDIWSGSRAMPLQKLSITVKSREGEGIRAEGLLLA